MSPAEFTARVNSLAASLRAKESWIPKVEAYERDDEMFGRIEVHCEKQVYVVNTLTALPEAVVLNAMHRALEVRLRKLEFENYLSEKEEEQ